jgi:cytochrome c oxidase subunit 2
LSSTILAILGADVGLGIYYLAVIFAASTAITAIVFVMLYWSTKHPKEFDHAHSPARFEPHYVALIVIIFILFSVTTLPYLPYPYAHSVVPNEQVDVQAQQFAWCLSMAPSWGPPCLQVINIKLGDIVEFNVQSLDVTHGFGVYQWTPNSSQTFGRIIFQVQVMPNYTNHVEYRFTSTGVYYIRCLEFCGYGHYTMISTFNISATSA